MAKCSYCNTTILFGGARDGDRRFCNQKCQQKGALLEVAAAIPDDEINRRVAEIHQGPCPRCQRDGFVDVHTAHSVWSAVILTSWKSTPQVSCTPCGKKAKLKATAGSVILGWWGFPWGLLLTPVQVSRNLWGLARSEPSLRPSPQLEKLVRLNYAAELSRSNNAGPIPPLMRN